MPNNSLYDLIETETFDSQTLFPKTKDASKVTQTERDDFLKNHWYSGRITKGTRKEYHAWVTADLKNRNENNEKISETEILTIKQAYEKNQAQKRIENEKYWAEQRLKNTRAIAEKKQAKLAKKQQMIEQKQKSQLNKKAKKSTKITEKKARKTEQKQIALNHIAEIRAKKKAKLKIKKTKLNKEITAHKQEHLTHSNKAKSKQITKSKKRSNQILITMANYKSNANNKPSIKSKNNEQKATNKNQLENLKFDFSNLKTTTFAEKFWQKLQSQHNLQIPQNPISHHYQTANDHTIDQISHDYSKKVNITDAQIVNDTLKNFTISTKDWQEAGPSCTENITTAEINQTISYDKLPTTTLAAKTHTNINKPKLGHKQIRNLSESRIKGKGHGKQPVIAEIFITKQQITQPKNNDDQTKLKSKSKLIEQQENSEISFSFN